MDAIMKSPQCTYQSFKKFRKTPQIHCFQIAIKGSFQQLHLIHVFDIFNMNPNEFQIPLEHRTTFIQIPKREKNSNAADVKY